MTRHSLRIAVVVSAALALAGCGSSSNDDDSGSSGVSPQSSDIPASALANAQSFVAFVSGLITNSTNETSEPIRVGEVTVPTSDTTEP